MKTRMISLVATAVVTMIAFAPAAQAGGPRDKGGDDRGWHDGDGNRGWRGWRGGYERPRWRPHGYYAPPYAYYPPPVYYAPPPYAYVAPPSIYFGFTVR